MIRENRLLILKCSAILLVIIIILFIFQFDIESLVIYFKNKETDPLILLSGFILLPMIFFPMSPLLILMGLKFSTLSSLLITFTVVPVHLLLSYSLVNFFFRDTVKRYAKKHNFRIFNISKNRRIEVCFLIMSMPGLPYALKNYILPVSNIRLREYLFIGWVIQFVMCLPFILLGDAASDMSLYFLFIFFIIALLIYFLIKVLRKKLSHINVGIKKM